MPSDATPARSPQPPSAASDRDATLAEALAIATSLHTVGRLGEASRVYAEVLRVAPAHATALAQYGLLAHQLGQHAEAAKLLRRALVLRPDVAEWHSNLAAVLLALGEPDTAAAAAQQALAVDADFAAAWNHLGNAERERDRPEAAERAYRRALELGASSATTLVNLGTILHASGRIDEAIAIYRQALAVRPEYARAWYHLADVVRAGQHDFAADEVATLRQAVPGAESRSLEEAGYLHFALAAWYDRQADADAAFEHYRRANACRREEIQRQGKGFDRQSFAALIDDVIGVFSRGWPERLAHSGETSDLPVFIVGMPRSGTTLLEQVLGSHSQAAALGERTDVERIAQGIPERLGVANQYPACLTAAGVEPLAELAREYLAHLRQLGGPAVRVIDKMPGNFVHLGLIALLLPQARVIHCQRDPLDTCLSCYFQRFTDPWLASLTASLDDLGFYFGQYQRLMQRWRATLPLRILDVQYESFVADFEPQARRLVDFAGLPWEDACLRFHERQHAVRTASTLQVRQKIHRTSLGRWRLYEKHLTPLIASLRAACVPVLSPSECR